MPKNTLVPRCDVAADVTHIQQALLKIENPHMRYLVAQFVDLVAEGVIALNGRAPSIAEFGRKQPRKSRTRTKTANLSIPNVLNSLPSG